MHILQSIDFVDVHLAVAHLNLVTQSRVDGKQKPGEKVACLSGSRLQIFQWIYSNNSIPQFQRHQFEFGKHLVGTSLPLFSRTPGENQTASHHCPVIVIQPRRQSIWRCCAIDFDAMLDHLEFRISSDGGSKILRKHLFSCLADTLDYCRQDPLNVWDVPGPAAVQRTIRLLNICIELQAEKVGLELIEILGIDVEKLRQNEEVEMFYEGIRNETVARSIIALMLITGGNFPSFIY